MEARISALEQASRELQQSHTAMQQSHRQLLQRFDAMAASLDAKIEDFNAVLARAEASTYSEIVADVARHHDAFVVDVCRH